eukprot:PLAT3589.1.p1 GENE.PLAT3589.1~~PLAT3589.1.p1  ORF type:complete len:1110 (-),score=563.04 PLAT3589.1:124-3162(-)
MAEQAADLVALVGPADDEPTRIVSLLTRESGMPIVGYAATAEDLGNPAEFPTFLRTCPSDSLSAESTSAMLAAFQWKQAVIVVPGSERGVSSARALRSALQDQRIMVTSTILLPMEMGEQHEEKEGDSGHHDGGSEGSEGGSGPPPPPPPPSALLRALKEESKEGGGDDDDGAHESLTEVLHEIEESGTRLVLLAAPPVIAAELLKEAMAEGMTGFGWMWVGPDWLSEATFQLAGNDVRQTMHGSLGILPDAGDPSGLVALLDGRSADAVLSLPAAVTAGCTRRSAFEADKLPPYTTNAYDAVMSLAHGIADLARAGEAVTPSALLAATRSTAAFDGKSGRMAFAPDGNRQTEVMAVYNEQDGSLRAVGSYVRVGDGSSDSDAKGKLKLDTKAVIFPDGSNVPPTDRAMEEADGLSLYMFIVVLLMVLAFAIGHELELHKISWLPETAAVILLGVLLGVALQFGASDEARATARFDAELFTLVMLPIIIFESGYNMAARGLFFKNLGSILTFAVVGTMLVTVLVGAVLFALSSASSILPMGGAESFAFASLIAAVDPVATLSIFGAMDVEPVLNMIVFGESVINDAVSIVLFRTFTGFMAAPVTSGAVLGSVGKLFLLFFGSSFIGWATGLLAGKTFKLFHFHLKEIEATIVLLLSYAAFLSAEAAELSGIVASLSCGLTCASYVDANLAPSSKSFIKRVIKTTALLAETLIFFQVGVDIVVYDGSGDSVDVLFIIMTIVLISLGRLLFTFLQCAVVNRFREEPIPWNYQLIMWHAGLRGAIAYALAITFPSHNRDSIVGCTVAVIIFTVFIQGGTTTWMLRKLDIPTHVVFTDDEREQMLHWQPPACCRPITWLEEKVIRPFVCRDKPPVDQHADGLVVEDEIRHGRKSFAVPEKPFGMDRSPTADDAAVDGGWPKIDVTDPSGTLAVPAGPWGARPESGSGHDPVAFDATRTPLTMESGGSSSGSGDSSRPGVRGSLRLGRSMAHATTGVRARERMSVYPQGSRPIAVRW